MHLGETRGTEGEVREEAHLLAMNENVDASSEPVVYPADGGLEVRAEVGVSAVRDIEAAALELVALGGVGLDGGQPGRLEDLNDSLDLMGCEEGRVEDGSEGAKVEGACMLLGRGGKYRVHGDAHGLHDLGRKAGEADHG